MLRNSFLEPIEDLELAAKLLDAAADALFVGDRKLAVQLIVLANRPSIMEYAIQIVGKLSDDVHRQTKLPKTLPEDRRDRTRMPNKAVQYSIFSRDGWRCREGVLQSSSKQTGCRVPGGDQLGGGERVSATLRAVCNGSLSRPHRSSQSWWTQRRLQLRHCVLLLSVRARAIHP